MAERKEEKDEKIVEKSGNQIRTDDPEDSENGEDGSQHLFAVIRIGSAVVDGEIPADVMSVDGITAAAVRKRSVVVGNLAW